MKKIGESKPLNSLVQLDKTAKLYQELNKKKIKRRDLWRRDWNK
jgi:hypothetical protein